MAADQRIVRLLASIIGVSGDYALARLELGMNHPGLDLPPTLPRLTDASEATLRLQWGEIERRLEHLSVFVKTIETGPAGPLQTDPAYLWIRRTARELDQYARALRWVLTVTERISDE